MPGETITLTISRSIEGGQGETLDKQITLRDPRWPEESELPGSPASIPALGITVNVLNTVQAVDPGSPAAGVSLAPGDKIVKAEIELPPREQRSKQDPNREAFSDRPEPFEFNDEKLNWPFFMRIVQWVPDGTKIRLTLSDGRSSTVEVRQSEDWFYFDRGLIFTEETTTAKAHSVGEALVLAAHETRDSLLQVYSFIRKIGTQVSPLSLGGPKEIAKAAGYAAYEGVSSLLIFLTMLSANLAVINFLPIPLLDGGHMVFLLLEGLMGRPVSERVVVAFHYLGFVFIISLMMFVLGLDFGLIPRHH